MSDNDAYQPPPDGWVTFGSHANEECPHYKGPLIFSDEKGEDGFSLWERHDDCRLLTSDPKADYLQSKRCSVCHRTKGVRDGVLVQHMSGSKPCRNSGQPVEACVEVVWLDGIYRTTCGRAIYKGACGTHGESASRRPWTPTGGDQ